MTKQSQDIGNTCLVAPPIVATERILDLEGAFMKAAEAERAEVDIPFPIIDLDEADVFAAERLTDVDPLLVPADAAVIADASDFIVARILERRAGARDRAEARACSARPAWHRRALHAGGASLNSSRQVSKRAAARAGSGAGGRVHSRLSVRCMRSCRPFCCGEAGSMKSGRMPRRIHQTESAREAAERLGGKRDAIVGANADGQAILVKGADEDGPTLGDLRAGERATAEQEATVAVGDRERITERAVAEAELAFEVGGPDGIRAHPSALAVVRHGPGGRTRRGGTTRPARLR